MDKIKPVVPVTILTGFLGAGKTTLLNALLQNENQERIAIVENEFGAVSIDGGLLSNSQAVEVIELNNGCVCCSVRGELTEALRQLLAQIDCGELVIDRLILETTGLADPAPIIQTFFVDEWIRERMVLDAVVTLVDAEHVLKQLDEHRVAASQVGFADYLLLTKVDRVDEPHIETVLSRLHAINPKAMIEQVIEGKVAKEHWLGLQAFELSDDLQLSNGFYAVNPPKSGTLSPFKLQQKSFQDSIQSRAWYLGEVDIKAAGAWMEALIEQWGNDMLRYKGILAIANQEQRLIVQGIHKVVGFDYGSPWADEEQKQSVMVIIGRDLPWDDIEQSFLALA